MHTHKTSSSGWYELWSTEQKLGTTRIYKIMPITCTLKVKTGSIVFEVCCAKFWINFVTSEEAWSNCLLWSRVAPPLIFYCDFPYQYNNENLLWEKFTIVKGSHLSKSLIQTFPNMSVNQMDLHMYKSYFHFWQFLLMKVGFSYPNGWFWVFQACSTHCMAPENTEELLWALCTF